MTPSFSPFFQLPHFNHERASQAKQGESNNNNSNSKRNKNKPVSFLSYLELEDGEKKGLEGLTEEEKEDVLNVCHAIPRIEAIVDAFIYSEEEEEGEEGEEKKGENNENDDEDDDADRFKNQLLPGRTILEGDIVTLRFKMRRLHVWEGEEEKGGEEKGDGNIVSSSSSSSSSSLRLTKGKLPELTNEQKNQDKELIPSIHSPYSLDILPEHWWAIILNEKNEVRGIKRIVDQSIELEKQFLFQAPMQAGDYDFSFRLIPEGYLGLEYTYPFHFTVHSKEMLPSYEVHERDLQISKDPTMFEQIANESMLLNVDEDDSDNEEEGGESRRRQQVVEASENSNEKTSKKKKKKCTKKKKNSKNSNSKKNSNKAVAGFESDDDEEFEDYQIVDDVSDEED